MNARIERIFAVPPTPGGVLGPPDTAGLKWLAPASAWGMAAAIAVLWVTLGGAAGPAWALTQISPSNLLREGEGMLGAEFGLVNEKVSLTGDFGTGAARSDYALEAAAFVGEGAYGFTEDLDVTMRIGGLLSPSLSDKSNLTGLLGGVGMRYSLVGSRSAELGVFGSIDYLSAVTNDAKLRVGNVNVPGRVELRSILAATIGLGPVWWWSIGAQQYIFPGVYAFLSPRWVGDGYFTQAGQAAAQTLSDVEGQLDSLGGFGGTLGLDLRLVMLKLGVKWAGRIGASFALEVPF